MSIASRITSIEGHISDIYDSVELTGVDTTDIDKNLVNVPNTLKEGYIDIINNGTDTLYNNFPKVSGEGTSLTLNNTYQAPMRNLPKGNTSQITTTQSSNLFDENYYNNDNLYSINVYKYTLTRIKGGRVLYVRAILKEGKTNINGLYVCLSNNPNPNQTGSVYAWMVQNGTATANPYNATELTDLYFSCYVSDFGSISITDIFDTYNFIVGTSSSAIGTYTPFVPNSPSPDYPQEVDVVSGDNTITISNQGGTDSNTYNIDLPVENLFDETILSQEISYNTYNSSTGLWTTNSGGGYCRSILYSATGANSSRDITKLLSLHKNTQYTLYLYDFTNSTSDTNYLSVALFDNTGTQISTVDTKNNYTFTTPSQDCYLDIRRGANSGYFTFSHISIYKGSKSNSYTPYGTTPIELCKIGDYQDLFKRSTGINLAPINLESETYNTLEITNNNNGTFTLLGNPTGSFGRDIATNLTLKAGTYTISANEMPSGLYIALDNEADTQLSNGTLSKTFTLASDTTYTSLGIWFTKNKDYDVTIQLQIEEGSSVTEWQPMNGWYLHKEIGKVVLNGSESWNRYGTSSIERYYLQNMQWLENLGYCDYASIGPYNQRNNTTQNNKFFIGGDSLQFRRDDLVGQTTVAAFKTWLSEHNTTVYYAQSTPTNEPIPSNLINQLEEFYQAQSKNNQTNISQINNDLPFIVSASALKKGV